MFNLLLIFLGSGVGGVCRFLSSNLFYIILGRHFPYGTLFVNTIGSFLMGFLFTLLTERFNGIGLELRSLLLIGFLGGFTTFSSFSIETLNLFQSGSWLSASLNILLSLILCLSLTWAGILVGRSL